MLLDAEALRQWFNVRQKAALKRRLRDLRVPFWHDAQEWPIKRGMGVPRGTMGYGLPSLDKRGFSDMETRDLDGLLRQGLVPVDEAAATLGIEPKRLRGFILRNGIADPIGDMAQVYGWSCARLAADAGSESR